MVFNPQAALVEGSRSQRAEHHDLSPRNIYRKKYFATFSQSSVLNVSAFALPQLFSGLEIERI
jgi:hypothetical protein